MLLLLIRRRCSSATNAATVNATAPSAAYKDAYKQWNAYNATTANARMRYNC